MVLANCIAARRALQKLEPNCTLGAAGAGAGAANSASIGRRCQQAGGTKLIAIHSSVGCHAQAWLSLQLACSTSAAAASLTPPSPPHQRLTATCWLRSWAGQ